MESKNLVYKETLFDNGPYVGSSDDLFTNTKDETCDITSCSLKKVGCVDEYIDDDLKIE